MPPKCWTIATLQLRFDFSKDPSKHFKTENEHASPTLSSRNQSPLRTEPLVPYDNSGAELRRLSRTSTPTEQYFQNIYD